MHRLIAFAFSLSLPLLGALAAVAALAPSMALADDPALKSAQQLVEQAEKKLAELQPGDVNAGNAVIGVNNQAIQRLNNSSKKGTPEWKALVERTKVTSAKARELMAAKPDAPAPPPAGPSTPPTGPSTPPPPAGPSTPPAGPGTPPTGGPAAAVEPDEPLNDAKGKVEELEGDVEKMALNDKAELKRLDEVVAKVVAPLLGQSKTRSHPLWAEVKKRAETLLDKAKLKARGKDPSTVVAAPAIDWSGEPDVSKVSAGDKQKYETWKSDYRFYWEQLHEPDPMALASQNPDGKKKSFEVSLKKSRDALRYMVKASIVNDFVARKEQDLLTAFDARVAEGKQKLAEAESKTDGALTSAMTAADALDEAVKALKMGDVAGADALLARKAATLALLESTTAKTNPAYAKTKSRLGAIEGKINLRKAGKADDPTLAIDLSDAPIDALEPSDVGRVDQWKEKFTWALKTMLSHEDFAFTTGRWYVNAEGDMNRAREGTINYVRNKAAILPWIEKKEAEYKALLQKKTAAGQKLIDEKAAGVAARHAEGKAIAAEIQAARELTALDKPQLDINMKYAAEDLPGIEAYVLCVVAHRDMQKKWGEKAKKMKDALADCRDPVKIDFTGSSFGYKYGDGGSVAAWILGLEKAADQAVAGVLEWFDKKIGESELNCPPLEKFSESDRSQLAWPPDEGSRASYATLVSKAAHAARFAQMIESRYKGAAAPTWAARTAMLEARWATIQAAQAAAVAAVRFPADKEFKDARLQAGAEDALKESGYTNVKRVIPAEKAKAYKEVRWDDNAAYLQRWEEFEGWAVWQDAKGRLRIATFIAQYSFEGRGKLEKWFVSRWNAWDIILPENVDK